MARRVKIRSRQLHTAVAELEDLIQTNYKEIVRKHKEDLEAMAEFIEEDAWAITPVKTGRLQESISIRVSQSNRWPGIIAHASAKNEKTGYDYAWIQDANTDYSHEEPGEAHYLSGPFYHVVDQFWYEWTGKHIQLPEEWNRW